MCARTHRGAAHGMAAVAGGPRRAAGGRACVRGQTDTGLDGGVGVGRPGGQEAGGLRWPRNEAEAGRSRRAGRTHASNGDASPGRTANMPICSVMWSCGQGGSDGWCLVSARTPACFQCCRPTGTPPPLHRAGQGTHAPILWGTRQGRRDYAGSGSYCGSQGARGGASPMRWRKTTQAAAARQSLAHEKTRKTALAAAATFPDSGACRERRRD